MAHGMSGSTVNAKDRGICHATALQDSGRKGSEVKKSSLECPSTSRTLSLDADLFNNRKRHGGIA
jgi:hypothetical protein